MVVAFGVRGLRVRVQTVYSDVAEEEVAISEDRGANTRDIVEAPKAAVIFTCRARTAIS